MHPESHESHSDRTHSGVRALEVAAGADEAPDSQANQAASHKPKGGRNGVRRGVPPSVATPTLAAWAGTAGTTTTSAPPTAKLDI